MLTPADDGRNVFSPVFTHAGQLLESSRHNLREPPAAALVANLQIQKKAPRWA
jgi:hypothetical protein